MGQLPNCVSYLLSFIYQDRSLIAIEVDQLVFRSNLAGRTVQSRCGPVSKPKEGEAQRFALVSVHVCLQQIQACQQTYVYYVNPFLSHRSCETLTLRVP